MLDLRFSLAAYAVRCRLKNIGRPIAWAALCATVVACSTTNYQSSNRRGDANGMYRVRSGDTLYLIAKANGVRYTDIMAWNGLNNPNYLEVGWRLRVRPNANGGTDYTPSSPAQPPRATPPRVSNDPEIKVNPVINNTIAWVWPNVGPVVRPFDGNQVKGIIFGGEQGSAVQAASGGEVIYVGSSLRGYGNMVVIKHNETWSSVYANNQSILVRQGERVVAGERIATMGSSDAPRTQLYFEVRQNAKPIDPIRVLPNR